MRETLGEHYTHLLTQISRVLTRKHNVFINPLFTFTSPETGEGEKREEKEGLLRDVMRHENKIRRQEVTERDCGSTTERRDRRKTERMSGEKVRGKEKVLPDAPELTVSRGSPRHEEIIDL